MYVIVIHIVIAFCEKLVRKRSRVQASSTAQKINETPLDVVLRAFLFCLGVCKSSFVCEYAPQYATNVYVTQISCKKSFN